MSETGRSYNSGTAVQSAADSGVQNDDGDAIPKVGYGDHKLRGRRGLDIDVQDLALVQRKELRKNVLAASIGGVRTGCPLLVR